ncbi:hypothetical protein ACHAQA_000890 [Verticillium albo-atrum]
MSHPSPSKPLPDTPSSTRTRLLSRLTTLLARLHPIKTSRSAATNPQPNAHSDDVNPHPLQMTLFPGTIAPRKKLVRSNAARRSSSSAFSSAMASLRRRSRSRRDGDVRPGYFDPGYAQGDVSASSADVLEMNIPHVPGAAWVVQEEEPRSTNGPAQEDAVAGLETVDVEGEQPEEVNGVNPLEGDNHQVVQA